MFHINESRNKIIDISCDTVGSSDQNKLFIPKQNRLPDGTICFDVVINTHTGTHIEAPAHFYENGMYIDEFPLIAFMGRGLLLEALPGKITPELLELRLGNLIGEHDIIICRNNCQEGDSRAFFTPESAGWLADRKIKLLGIDRKTGLGINLADSRAVHDIIFSCGGMLLEGLCNLQEISRNEFQVIALPYKAKLDSSWTRALVIEENI